MEHLKYHESLFRNHHLNLIRLGLFLYDIARKWYECVAWKRPLKRSYGLYTHDKYGTVSSILLEPVLEFVYRFCAFCACLIAKNWTYHTLPNHPPMNMYHHVHLEINRKHPRYIIIVLEMRWQATYNNIKR